MVNQDTISILKECDSGAQMGAESIEEVLEHVKDSRLRRVLEDSRTRHKNIGEEAHAMLSGYGEEGKAPGAMAKGMSWMKTNMKLSMNDDDSTVAELITDGCNMGVKSLNRYLNQYPKADDRSQKIAQELIHLEEKTAVEVRQYL